MAAGLCILKMLRRGGGLILVTRLHRVERDPPKEAKPPGPQIPSYAIVDD